MKNFVNSVNKYYQKDKIHFLVAYRLTKAFKKGYDLKDENVLENPAMYEYFSYEEKKGEKTNTLLTTLWSFYKSRCY